MRHRSRRRSCVWKLPDPWTHRTRPPILCKTTERFCTSFHTPHRRVPFSEERKTKTSQNQSATHRFCGGGRLSKGIPHVAEWFNEPIGIDLRRLRTRMMHYAYTKTCGSPGWVVEPT